MTCGAGHNPFNLGTLLAKDVSKKCRLRREAVSDVASCGVRWWRSSDRSVERCRQILNRLWAGPVWRLVPRHPCAKLRPLRRAASFPAW